MLYTVIVVITCTSLQSLKFLRIAYVEIYNNYEILIHITNSLTFQKMK